MTVLHTELTRLKIAAVVMTFRHVLMHELCSYPISSSIQRLQSKHLTHLLQARASARMEHSRWS